MRYLPALLRRRSSRRVSRVASRALGALFCLAVLALTACGQVSQAGGNPAAGNSQGTANAQETATASAVSIAQGTISGEVVAGPTCPVEQADTPCPPKPVPHREVTVTAASGAVAATTTTDDAGHFSVRVAPGKYTVHVKAGPGLLGISQASPGDVTVQANQTSALRIELDTGIR